MDLSYVRRFTGSERSGVERELFTALSQLGFKVVASSDIGASVTASRRVVESTFGAKIEVHAATVEGPPSGKVYRLSFSQPPTIPNALAPYVKAVKFSPPVLPLS
jgi:hypothetical protein